jgi:hypothetical protein
MYLDIKVKRSGKCVIENAIKCGRYDNVGLSFFKISSGATCNSPINLFMLTHSALDDCSFSEHAGTPLYCRRYLPGVPG